MTIDSAVQSDAARAGTAAGSGKPDPWPLLSRLSGPADLAGLVSEELSALAAQIRCFLVERVCATGGHLGVNLGVVELTIALHRAFHSPHDALIFDTGHQAYVHKILTGRADGFAGLRRQGGLSGYPSRAESEHDWVESSHASVSLSYAAGIARGFALRNRADRRVVAVIGDGALTGGVAWEAVNDLAAAAQPVVVVLNDNGRSYDPTVGGLARHLERSRDGGSEAGAWFRDLGLAYLGPIDGHDIAAVEQALRRARALSRPVVVHCVTVKGRGYRPAEEDPADRMHGIGVLDPATGRPPDPGEPSWTGMFGAELAAIGAERPEVVAVTAAMRGPVGLAAFAERFPDRVFDAGIAEQHAVCSAAGLAMAGAHPVVCLYATFLNRAFDQVVMDVALHRLPVTLVLDRAGITGPDGASHHGMWDGAILGAVPGLRVAAPRDPARLRELLREAVAEQGPTALRFPKAEAGPDLPAIWRADGIDILHRSAHRPLDVLLVAAGTMAGPCLAAARELEESGLGVTVVDPRWVLPIADGLTRIAARHRLVLTVEDGSRAGGLGTAMQTACADLGIAAPVRVLALPGAFLPHGQRQDLLASAGLDAAGIAKSGLAAARQAGVIDGAAGDDGPEHAVSRPIR